MLCVVPLLRALREKYPDVYLVLMTSPVNHEVIVNSRYINKVINYDKREFLGRGFAGWKNLLAYVKKLRDEQFELAIVPSTVSTSFTSDLFAFLSGAPVRIGVSSLNDVENPSGFFFNAPIPLNWMATPHRHQTLRNLDVAELLGLSVSKLHLEITLDSNEQTIANQLKFSRLEQEKKVIVYHPGAGKTANRWDAKRFAFVANTLAQELNVSTAITWGPMDDEPVSEMIQLLSVPYTLIKGKTIREVATILSTVALVISNDTGIMHVAAAVGIPVLSLFGPTDAEQWAPIGVKNRYIQGTDRNINNISADEVLMCAREMLSEQTTQS